MRAAWTAGCRGIVFRSATPLDDGSPQTRRRAAMLEHINRRLQLVEPWIASGKLGGPLVSTDGTWRGVVFHVDRARLVVPVSADQFTGADRARSSVPSGLPLDVEFVVPGVPASSEAYYLSPAVMRPLPLERVAGGTRFTAPVGAGGTILITEDRQIIQSFRQRIARDASHVARLERDYVTELATAVMGVERDLNQLGYRSAASGTGGGAGSCATSTMRGILDSRPLRSGLRSHRVGKPGLMAYCRGTASHGAFGDRFH